MQKVVSERATIENIKGVNEKVKGMFGTAFLKVNYLLAWAYLVHLVQ